MATDSRRILHLFATTHRSSSDEKEKKIRSQRMQFDKTKGDQAIPVRLRKGLKMRIAKP